MNRRNKRRLGAAMVGVMAFALWSCTGSPSNVGGVATFESARFSTDASVMDQSLGVTQGGAQDMEFARQQIEKNRVPKPEAILTEGLFSEYDLALAGEPTNDLLSINTGAGMIRDAEGKPHYIVQLGMSSNLTPETFRRPKLNVSLLIDSSGSMRGEKIAAARRAASKVLGSLNKDDYFSLVTFDSSASVEVSSTQIRDQDDRKDVEEEIDEIEASGSTDMEEGMVEAYEQIESRMRRPNYEHRLIMITDARPNTGRFGESDFLRLVERWSAKGVGLSAIGLGANFGVDLATQISNVRGGNYRFAPDGKALGELFEKDFDYLVSPLAYDMKLRLAVAEGYRISAVHGLPGWEDGDSTVELEVATLFLSRNKGALAIEIEPYHLEAEPNVGEEIALLESKLSFLMKNGQRVKSSHIAKLPRPALKDRASFTHSSVAKVAALAFSAAAMRSACKAWHEGERAEAKAHIESVPELVEELATNAQIAELFSHVKLLKELEKTLNNSPEPEQPVWRQVGEQEKAAPIKRPKDRPGIKW